MASRTTALGMGDDDDVLKPLVEDESGIVRGSNSAIVNVFDTNTGITENHASNSSSSLMKLRIKSSYEDMEIEIPNRGCPKTTSVAQLKALIRTALMKKEAEKEGSNNGGGGVKDRYMRLICKGRLLSPDESFLSEFKVVDNDVVHAVLGAAAPATSSPRRGQRQLPEAAVGSFQHLLQHQRRRRQRPNRGIGTIIGPGGRVTRSSSHPSEDSSDDENDLEQGTARERRGFDRLRGAGLSRQEITALRTYFNRHVDRYIQQQEQQGRAGSEDGTGAAVTPPSTLHLDEPDLSRRRLLVEEEWMATQGAASEFRLNLNQNTLLRVASNGLRIGGANSRGSMPRERPGNDRDFVWGFCLGFFVGVISLVWVWMPTIPHKQKLGILTGICFQLILESANKDLEDDQVFDGGGEDSAYDDAN